MFDVREVFDVRLGLFSRSPAMIFPRNVDSAMLKSLPGSAINGRIVIDQP